MKCIKDIPIYQQGRDTYEKKVLHFLDEHFEEMMLVILLAVMTASIFYQVVMRYVFNSAPSWTEELCRYSFIWCAYFGVSLGVKAKCTYQCYGGSGSAS